MTAALDKMFLVLEVVSAGPVTAAKAATLTGLNRTTTHRLLKQSEQNRYTVRDLLGRYVIGPRYQEFSEARLADPLQHESDEILDSLQSATGGDAALFRAEGLDRVCIAASLAAGVPIQNGLQVGARLGPSPCASALALLAWNSQRRVAARHLGVSAQDFAAIRKQGWAHSTSGEGINVLAAPIRDTLGEVMAAVAVFGGTWNQARSAIVAMAEQVVASANRFNDAIARTALAT